MRPRDGLLVSLRHPLGDQAAVPLCALRVEDYKLMQMSIVSIASLDDTLGTWGKDAAGRGVLRRLEGLRHRSWTTLAAACHDVYLAVSGGTLAAGEYLRQFECFVEGLTREQEEGLGDAPYEMRHKGETVVSECSPDLISLSVTIRSDDKTPTGDLRAGRWVPVGWCRPLVPEDMGPVEAAFELSELKRQGHFVERPRHHAVAGERHKTRKQKSKKGREERIKPGRLVFLEDALSSRALLALHPLKIVKSELTRLDGMEQPATFVVLQPLPEELGFPTRRIPATSHVPLAQLFRQIWEHPSRTPGSALEQALINAVELMQPGRFRASWNNLMPGIEEPERAASPGFGAPAASSGVAAFGVGRLSRELLRDLGGAAAEGEPSALAASAVECDPAAPMPAPQSLARGDGASTEQPAGLAANSAKTVQTYTTSATPKGGMVEPLARGYDSDDSVPATRAAMDAEDRKEKARLAEEEAKSAQEYHEADNTKPRSPESGRKRKLSTRQQAREREGRRDEEYEEFKAVALAGPLDVEGPDGLVTQIYPEEPAAFDDNASASTEPRKGCR